MAGKKKEEKKSMLDKLKEKVKKANPLDRAAKAMNDATKKHKRGF